MMRTQQPAKQIEQTIRILEKAKLRGKVKIAFDEWNLRGWLHPTFPCSGADKNRIKDRDGNDVNSLYTMADAVFSACVLNTFVRNCRDVEIGGFSPVINTRGALFVHPKGIVRRTTFHVLSMYANNLKKNYLPLDVKCEDLTAGESKTPVLDLVLTCDDAKKCFVLAAVNKSPDKAIDLELPFTPEKNAEITRLSGKSPDDYNDVGSENNVVPVKTSENLASGKVTLPPHSVSLIELFITH
jgi:alpha-N-arabinofuranosidase